MENICYSFILMYLLQLHLQIILSHRFLFASEENQRQNEQVLRHWDVFSGEIENAHSRLLRRQLWQRISGLAFVESFWNMEQCGDKPSLQSFSNSDLRGEIAALQTECSTSENPASFVLTVDKKLAVTV